MTHRGAIAVVENRGICDGLTHGRLPLAHRTSQQAAITGMRHFCCGNDPAPARLAL